MPRTQQLPELIRGPTDDPTVLATGSWAESDWYAVPAAPTLHQNSPTYWAYRILIFMTPQICKLANLKICQRLIFTVLQIHNPLDLIDFQN